MSEDDDYELEQELANIMIPMLRATDEILSSSGLPPINADFLPGGMVLVPGAADSALTFEEFRYWLDGYLACVKQIALQKGTDNVESSM